MIQFLTERYEEGLAYRTINSYRSALSAFGIKVDEVPIGSHPTVNRLLKGIYNLRPPCAKYTETWDVNVVLKYLEKMQPVNQLSLKELTLKLVLLLAITKATRLDTLAKLSIRGLIRGEDFILLSLDSPLKNHRKGDKLEFVKIEQFIHNEELCVKTVLEEYLSRTKSLRSSPKLFVSLQSPYKAVTKQTLSRWLKQGLKNAGIDIEKYSAHSARGASVSKAKAANFPIDEILKIGGWRKVNTFNKFYNLKIVNSSSFSEMILSM